MIIFYLWSSMSLRTKFTYKNTTSYCSVGQKNLIIFLIYISFCEQKYKKYLSFMCSFYLLILLTVHQFTNWSLYNPSPLLLPAHIMTLILWVRKPISENDPHCYSHLCDVRKPIYITCSCENTKCVWKVIGHAQGQLSVANEHLIHNGTYRSQKE